MCNVKYSTTNDNYFQNQNLKSLLINFITLYIESVFFVLHWDK